MDSKSLYWLESVNGNIPTDCALVFCRSKTKQLPEGLIWWLGVLEPKSLAHKWPQAATWLLFGLETTVPPKNILFVDFTCIRFNGLIPP